MSQKLLWTNGTISFIKNEIGVKAIDNCGYCYRYINNICDLTKTNLRFGLIMKGNEMIDILSEVA